MRKLSNHLTGALAAAAVGLAAAVTSAAAVTDTEFLYTTPKTGYLTISNMDLAPDGSATASATYFNAWRSNNLTGEGCFNTGVNLPHAATLTAVRVWYSNNTESPGPYVVLASTLLATGATDFLLANTMAVTQGARKGVEIRIAGSPIYVNNATKTYGFGVCLEQGVSFMGARITYTYTSAGD